MNASRYRRCRVGYMRTQHKFVLSWTLEPTMQIANIALFDIEFIGFPNSVDVYKLFKQQMVFIFILHTLKVQIRRIGWHFTHLFAFRLSRTESSRRFRSSIVSRNCPQLMQMQFVRFLLIMRYKTHLFASFAWQQSILLMWSDVQKWTLSCCSEWLSGSSIFSHGISTWTALARRWTEIARRAGQTHTHIGSALGANKWPILG